MVALFITLGKYLFSPSARVITQTRELQDLSIRIRVQQLYEYMSRRVSFKYGLRLFQAHLSGSVPRYGEMLELWKLVLGERLLQSL